MFLKLYRKLRNNFSVLSITYDAFPTYEKNSETIENYNMVTYIEIKINADYYMVSITDLWTIDTFRHGKFKHYKSLKQLEKHLLKKYKSE